jgi:hypothetical protein
MIAWCGQMSCLSHCSLHLEEITFGENERKLNNLECLVPTVKHGEVLWWFGQQNRDKVICCSHYYPSWPSYCNEYGDRLANQVHPMIQTLFANNDVVFQDDSAPVRTAGTVQSWFDEHGGELQHLPWPAQSSDLNISGPLLSVLETRVRNRFPPPTYLK